MRLGLYCIERIGKSDFAYSGGSLLLAFLEVGLVSQPWKWDSQMSNGIISNEKSSCTTHFLILLQCIMFPAMFAGLKDHVHHELTRSCLYLEGKQRWGLI